MSITDQSILKKLNVYNGRTKKISHNKESDLALKNQYIFFRGFDIVDFSNGIDWNYKHKHTATTYQVYLHSLNIVKHLTNSYLITGKEDYASKARELIMNWINSEENKSFYQTNASWKDHSVASRMKNFVYFQYNLPVKWKLEEQIFEDTLQKHCEFLSLREFYSENNHGMMSDEALLFLSSFVKDSTLYNNYSDTAILRMERIIYKLFSSSSFNLENSPEYHRLTQNLSSRFIKLVDILGFKFDSKCRDIIKKSYDRNKAILKPDTTYPLIGDTGIFQASLKKSFENFIDYQAGVVFLNTKNYKDVNKSSYLSFKAGYLTRSHKHYDDLSLIYFYKGENILIDSGKYTYDKTNLKKSYIISPQAHSTIHKINHSYNLNNIVEDVDSLKINFVYENNEYIHIAAINHLYENLKIYRDIIYFENEGFVIVDRCFSNELQFLGQNFNLAPELKIEKVNSREYHLSTHGKQTLILKEHTDRTLSKYFNHSDSNRGFYSIKFNELLSTHQIEFRKNSSSAKFITSLFDKNSIEINNFEIDDYILKYKIKGVDSEVKLQKLK